MNKPKKIGLLVALGTTFASHLGFAQIPQNDEFVKEHPYFSHIDGGDLSPQERGQWVERLSDTTTKWRQEDLDALYSRLTSGPMPSGFHDGMPIMPMDAGINIFEDIGLPVDAQEIRDLAQLLWRGKYFNAKDRYLKNRIACETLPKALTNKYFPAIKCQHEGTGFSAQDLKFAAKVFCGQSLLDGRRESIVIDYAYGDDIKEDISPDLWDSHLDPLAGRKGLAIRDEIRMVDKGFYLGRAHLKGAFVLWFTLKYNAEKTADEDKKDINAEQPDACWIGHQRQRQRNLAPSNFVNAGEVGAK